MEVKAGYKQTEVGVIPSDWNINALGNVGDVIRGASPRPKGDKRFYGGDIPRLMVEDVTRDGKVVIPQIDFLTEEGAKRSRPCKKGTLTIVCSGTVGIPSFLGVDACIHDGFLALINIRKKISDDYLYHQLVALRESFENSATHGGIFTNLTTAGVKEFVVPFPPTREEQEAIAEALSDADALIEALDGLIAKKRQVKQGAMQELLTGKRRLPGFSGKWTTKKLGELGKFYKGKGLPKDVLFADGKFPAIPYTAIYTDFNEVFGITFVRNYTSSSDTFFINDPHILIAGSSNMLENVGKVCAYVDDKPVAIGGDIILFKTIDDVRFISYLLNTPQHRKKIVFLSQGSTIRHVYMSTFMNYEIEIPELKEQTAIAEILSDMDAEITALEGKLSKAREVKAGMMSELLTGRIRLIDKSG